MKCSTNLLRCCLLGVRADQVAVRFEPGQILEQFLGGRAVFMGKIVKTHQQPHLRLCQQALPATGPPTLGLLATTPT